MAVELNNNNISQFINSSEIVLVKLGAEWCTPCKTMDKILDTITEYPIGKVDIEEYSEICDEYKVRSIPQILIFKSGNHVGTISGVSMKETIIDKIEKATKP